MPPYAATLDPEAAFTAALAHTHQMIARLRKQGSSGAWSADAAERFALESGRQAQRLALQGFFDTRAFAEEQARATGQITAPIDAAGRLHTRVEAGHARALATTVGAVTVRRLAHRALGCENLYPADAELNLPDARHSHEVAKMAAIESARGSFADATAAITRACGPVAGPAQVRALAIDAAVDFDAFYTAALAEPCSDKDVLAISVDGKGIAMRPEHLREATRKAAAAAKARAGAVGEAHAGRKRMATLDTVYDTAPAPRRPHDVITLATAEDSEQKPNKTSRTRKMSNKATGDQARPGGKRPGPIARNKWLTGSVTQDAADVIANVFAQAADRDPGHRRTWVVLVDGAVAQLEAVKAEAAARGAQIHIVIDFIHVLQYLHQAARAAHPGETTGAESVAATWALAILGGRAAHIAATLADTAETDTLPAEDRKKIREAVTYLTNKAEHLRYDTALARGWPIATGVIEGACRHLIADRLDITGARWSLPGAEAVLKLRALLANGDFEAYWRFHLKQEHQRNHQARYQQQYQLAA